MHPTAESSAAGASWPRRAWRWCAQHRMLLGLLAVGLVFALSSIPNKHPPRIRGLDKLQHIAEYFAVTLLFLNATTRGYTRLRPLALLGAWLGIVGLSLLDETYQRWIPGRSFDLWDVAASASGGLAAVGAVLLVHAVLAHPERRP